jgi:hypothetical protein
MTTREEKVDASPTESAQQPGKASPEQGVETSDLTMYELEERIAPLTVLRKSGGTNPLEY